MAKRGRKRKVVVEDKAVFDWEKDRILPENLRDEMETMWEIPQIYHFLQLTKEALNISHLSMYEVERMLLMPKASKQLAHIMTCLLSSPSTIKSKLHKIPPMPYEFWTNILMFKLKGWFKIYQTKRQDPVKVFDVLGIEPEFWRIFPDAAAIEGKDFQDFSFKQRVWLLKTFCDTAMHSRKTIQDEIAKQPWESQFETVLGIDRYGSRYIYFPQFLHNDLRVYKHCLDNKVLSTVRPPVEEVKPKVQEVKEEPKPVPRFLSKKKRRRSRWSVGSLPPKKKEKRKGEVSTIDQSVIDSNSNSTDANFGRSSRSSSKASEMSSSSFAKSSGYETNISGNAVDNSTATENGSQKDKNVKELMKNLKSQIEEAVSSCSEKTEEPTTGNDVDKSSTALVQTEDSVAKESSFSTVDDLSKSSKTDDEKLEEISSMNASKVSDKSGDVDVQLFSSFTKDVNISKSDDEKLSESKKCDTSVDNELDEDMSLDKWVDRNKNRKAAPANETLQNSNDEASDSALSSSGTRRSARIKLISEIKSEVEDVETMLDVCESEEFSSIEVRDNLCRISSPEIENDESNAEFSESEWKVEDFNEMLTDLSVSNFQLVADSLDSLRELTESIASDRTVPGPDIKKENYTRPACEGKLLKRMKVLYASLEKVETILKESTKKARNKLQREWNNFENGVADEDQDACTEDGSNRWVVGPQGYPLQALAADHPLALPHSTIPPVGTRESGTDSQARTADADITQTTTNSTAQKETITGEIAETEATKAGAEQLQTEAQLECKREIQEEEDRDGQGEKAKGGKPGRKGSQEKKDGDENEDEEPQKTTRVLRARGVSSYTEQLFSDDESEEEKLDGWTDIEAIYASPGAQASASSPNTPAKAGDSYNDSEKDDSDSDQDWILPSTRKRKNKRPSASRRLKSFQNKLQSIKVDSEGRIIPNHQQQLPYIQALPPGERVSRSVKSPPTKLPPRPIHNTSRPLAPNYAAPPLVPSNPVKSEPQDPNLHSVLDIKDEGPIYDSASTGQDATCAQPNYVVVTTGHAPVANYYVMQQNPPVTAVVQQNQFMQPATFVSVPQQMQPVPANGYYVQQNQGQNYIVQGAPRQTFIASGNPQLVYQQQPTNYVQYVAAAQQQVSQPRIINTTTLTPPRQIAYRMRAPTAVQNNGRMPFPARQQNFPHPNGAVIRSAPIAPGILKPGQRAAPTLAGPRRQGAPRMPNPNKPGQAVASTAKGQKATSLIVLSDSDDDIEMIITEKGNTTTPSKRPIKPKPAPVQQQQQQLQLKPKVQLPAELMQRMSEGGISISPIKPAQSSASAQNTQLVVVVNETGSHYALALPNGSKLILTPEQVAQIRASNGGKLVL